jgi:small-conductance mechanosensitive channel
MASKAPFSLLFTIVLLVFTGFVWAQAPTLPSSQPLASGTSASSGEGSPVMVNGQTLFLVRKRVFSFSPEDRARAIEGRIRKLASGTEAGIRQITTVDAETTTEIVSGETVIMTVTDADAAAAGKPRAELANEYAQAIQSAAQSLRQQTSIRTLAMGALWTGLATIGFLLVLRLMAFFFPKLYASIRSWQGTYVRSIRIQKLELLSAQRITRISISLLRSARLFAVLVLFYFYISLVFSFFPWTRGYASVLLDYVLYPLRTVGAGFAAYLPNVFFVIVILAVSYYSIKLVKFLFAELGKETISFPGFYSDWAPPTYKIARFLIMAFTAVVVFPYLPGSQSPAFQGVSIFLGLLFSLGSSSAIANVVAGVVLTYTRAFQVGDRVKVGDAVGDVTEKTLLVTRIRTIKNVDISIPNAMVLSTHIVNYSSSAEDAGLILHTSVTIGYDAPWSKVHELLIEAARAIEDILPDPSPFVLQTSLDDFYVTYELNAYTNRPNRMAQIYSSLHQKIQDRFNEAGVEIMSPHYNAVRDGNTVAIPEKYWPKDYSAPPFQILAAGGAFSRKSASEAE